MSKTILITGTSSGFGRLMALGLAKKEHQVIAAMRSTTTKNKDIAKELSAIHNIEVVEMDVADTDSVNAAIEATVKKYGQIDVLVNNAGLTGFGLFEATSLDRMKNIYEVNVWGTVRSILAVLPSMRAHRSGLIINITSGLGLITAPYLGPYNGSKWAVEGITETLRYEVKDLGIEVVTLQPGAFPTGMSEKTDNGADHPAITEAYSADAEEKLQEFGRIMYGKMDEYKMDPQEIADAITRLVEMEPGTRPYYTAVNRVTNNLEQEYADKKTPYNREWLKRMGWAEWA